MLMVIYVSFATLKIYFSVHVFQFSSKGIRTVINIDELPLFLGLCYVIVFLQYFFLYVFFSFVKMIFSCGVHNMKY